MADIHSEAFDAFAATYDVEFAHSRAGECLRDAVWRRISPYLRPDMRVLDLGCGTGEDAIRLAQAGCRVTAADASPAMLNRVLRKVQSTRLSGKIELLQQDLNAPFPAAGAYDFVLSNFGALNCAVDLDPVAAMLHKNVVASGIVALTIMGRFCAWETIWYGLRGHRTAIRRWRGRATATIGNFRIPVRYWRVRDIVRALPQFELQAVHGIGIALPPSDLFRIFDKRPGLFRQLARWESLLSSHAAFARLADHQLLILRRVR